MQKAVFLAVLCAYICDVRAANETTKPPTAFNATPIHDVLQILPLSKIKEIENTHLETDEGFKAAVLYLQGSEWKGLVEAAVKSTQFKKFSEMALKFQINIAQAIECMKNHIEALKVPPSKEKAKPSLASFVDDVQKVLPLGEIAKVLGSTDNPKVKKIRLEIGTKENQKIAEDLHNLPEMVKMRQTLKSMNFDVEPYINLVYTFLGWIH